MSDDLSNAARCLPSDRTLLLAVLPDSVRTRSSAGMCVRTRGRVVGFFVFMTAFCASSRCACMGGTTHAAVEGKRPIAHVRAAVHFACVKIRTSTNGMNNFSKGNGMRSEPLFGDPRWIAERIRWIKGNMARRKDRAMMLKMQAAG